jgi:peptidoglycan hydrolase-like protein with peptidoglycan-binding domain
MGKSGGTADSIMAVQNALKDKGHDPGPIDGKMNPRTQAALKSFQSANNLQATGVLDAETSAKLGVRGSSSSSSKASSSDIGPSGTRGSMKSSDTTVGKDTDQPNRAPSPK